MYTYWNSMGNFKLKVGNGWLNLKRIAFLHIINEYAGMNWYA